MFWEQKISMSGIKSTMSMVEVVKRGRQEPDRVLTANMSGLDFKYNGKPSWFSKTRKGQ